MATSGPNSRTQIGPYRIVARVGAGGMGEVFKAWDPRLERDVAIKLIHPEHADNPDRQRRLVAEGRAASALNHPNILRVYDADVDGTSYYLVSEWLEGKSLRDEMVRGPLPLKRLLDLAVQIADGLAAAHAMGIVHRDIKPENVMLARDGTARIVDFGLARSDPHAPSMSTMVGQASTVSIEGGISGTPAYMSPEQARGTPGDFRTDQFSFGALMYEMATGKLAFRRDHVADTLSAVLHEEPAPIAELNPRIPSVVRWIVEQCLAKDATERYASTEDLARELRRVRDRLREVSVELKADDEKPATGRLWGMIASAAAATTITVAIGAGVLALTSSEPDLKFTPVASSSQYEGNSVWSPDGQSLAWVADVDGVLQVFVRRLADAVATQVTQGRFDAAEPFWSPDGRRLHFISLAGEGFGLWSVGVAGGRPELLLENVTQAAVDPLNRRLALLRMDPGSAVIQRVWWASPTGQNPEREMRAPFDKRGFGLGGQLKFSPDGRELLFWAFSDTQMIDQEASAFLLIATDPNGPVRRVLHSVVGTANLQPVGWFPDSRHVAVGIASAGGGNRHLWIADTQSNAIRRLTATHTNETWPSVSPDGTRIAYSSEEVDFDLVAISEDGSTRRTLLATARNELDPAWAPGGDQFAFVTDRIGTMEIWLRSRDGQWERPIVTAADFGRSRTDTFGSLAFSPDGRTLAYQRRGLDQANIWLTPSTGGTPVRLVSDTGNFSSYQDAPSWSPNGEWVAFVRSNGPEFSVAKVRMGSSEVVPLIEQVVPFARLNWSPDGKWLVSETLDGMVKVSADGGKPEILTSEPWFAFTWSADSRRLIALTASESQGHLSLISLDTVSLELTTMNADLGTIPIANQPIRGFSYAKGQGFLTSLASARSDIWLLEGFQQPGGWLSRLLGQ